MKKLVLLLAVVFGMSMVSCTGNAEQNAEATADSPATVVEETIDTAAAVVDTAAAAVDTAVAKVEEAAAPAEPAAEPAK